MTAAISQELFLQKNYLGTHQIKTIYFGGGTPSLLSFETILGLLQIIHDNFDVVASAEITLEANPDDLTEEKLSMLSASDINRLSIGIQSFDDNHLTYLNRTHNGTEAKGCVAQAREVGIDNISIDLIYAIAGNSHEIWENDLAQAIALKPVHISSYCLTIENNTAFGHWLKQGKIQPTNEEYATQQFEILINTLGNNGYEQYEVSNFCLPGQHSRHNSNYWKQESYLGVGPGAHSYNGLTRQYNIAHNKKYLDAIEKNHIPFIPEVLDHKDHINEYLLTTLRTKWGTDLNVLRENHDYDLFNIHGKYVNEMIQKELVTIDGNKLFLTNRGKLFADKIASDLFLV